MTEEREAKRQKKDGSLVEVLQRTVQGLEQSVSGAMEKMSTSLEQSVRMMQGMNGMMEDYVVRSISLQAQLHHRENLLFDLVVQIFNKSLAKLSNVELLLEGFGNKRRFVGELDAAGSTVTFQKVRLVEPKFKAVLQFPSPGTGKTLKHETEWPLHWRDLGSFQPSTCLQEIDKFTSVAEINMDAAELRKELSIPPTAGMAVGKESYFAKLPQIQIRPFAMMKDGGMVRVQCFFQDKDSEKMLLSAYQD